MTLDFASWWRARTMRERMLLRGGALFIVAVLAPLSAHQAAVRHRAEAAANLASAREIERRVAALSVGGAAAASDGSVRGAAMAAAEALGLSAARIEPRGQAALLIVFEAADSVRVYRWIELAGRAGVSATRTTITRAGENGLVNAEIELQAGL